MLYPHSKKKKKKASERENYIISTWQQKRKDKSQKHYAKRRKSDPRDCILNNSINTLLQKRGKKTTHRNRDQTNGFW